ncbi:MAG: M28 family peptidase [Acidobacteriota bacterium]
MRLFVISVVYLVLWQVALAQEIPFLTEEEYSWLVNEISGDSAYEHIRYFTQFHRPRGGSPGLMAVARYVQDKAKEYGLENVRLIRQKSNTVSWSNHYGDLWLKTPRLKRLASTTVHPLHLSDYSRTTHIEGAEIVSVGRGTKASDYDDRDVEGKIVLTYGPISRVMEEAVWKRNALGLISYPDPAVADYPMNSLSHPDQIRWSRIPVENGEGKRGTFGFRLTARQGLELENLLRKGEPVTARVDIQSQFPREKWQVMVEAFIQGSEIGDQDIVLTGHLQEEKYSANDDASGCASVLEIGRALKRLIDGGRIDRPRRNIRFWWVTEIGSERQYFADHPEAAGSMLVNINQDMVGANQAQDLLRVQNMCRVPFSRFHFLNDVAERIMEFTMESNKGNLAVLQAGKPFPYPRPILSRLGTRHRYNAEVIPFHNNTDHMTFNEAPIGVPAISFTNWPDSYIHSSDDDLWNIDRTQLQRNAFTVAAIAYTLAAAGPPRFDAIASEVGGRGMERLAEDFRLALGWLAQSKDRFYQGVHQLDQAAKREVRAISSLAKLAAPSLGRTRIEALLSGLRSSQEDLLRSLREQYRILYHSPAPPEQLSEVEKELQAMVPGLTGGPEEFLAKRSEIEAVSGLHSLMAFEILNFVDGERSGLEVFRAVAAEARRAGLHYYGEVSPEAVRDYLNHVKSAGLLKF